MNKKIILFMIPVILIVVLAIIFWPQKPTLDQFLVNILKDKVETNKLVSVSADQKTETHLRGKFKLRGESEKIFLSYKKDNKWELAYWGEGEMVCDILNQYAFPKDMVNDCVQIKFMEISKDQNLIVTLIGKKDSGYEWNANYDDKALKFITRQYIEMDASIGAGAGLDQFTFEPLKEGETEIEFVFRKADGKDDTAIDRVYYQIKIGGN